MLENIEASKSKWTHVTGRSLQAWGGVISAKGTLIPAPMPAWMSSIVNKVSLETELWGTNQKPNHVLVNKYEPGQGILPHKDGPIYFPATAILSLGSPAVMNFHAQKSDPPSNDQMDESSIDRVIAVALPRRSLLMFSEDMYEKYCHGIDFVKARQFGSCDSCDSINPVVNLVNPQHADAPDGIVARSGTRVSLTIRKVLKVQKSNLLRLTNTW